MILKKYKIFFNVNILFENKKILSIYFVKIRRTVEIEIVKKKL